MEEAQVPFPSRGPRSTRRILRILSGVEFPRDLTDDQIRVLRQGLCVVKAYKPTSEGSEEKVVGCWTVGFVASPNQLCLCENCLLQPPYSKLKISFYRQLDREYSDLTLEKLLQHLNFPRVKIKCKTIEREWLRQSLPLHLIYVSLTVNQLGIERHLGDRIMGCRFLTFPLPLLDELSLFATEFRSEKSASALIADCPDLYYHDIPTLLKRESHVFVSLLPRIPQKMRFFLSGCVELLSFRSSDFSLAAERVCDSGMQETLRLLVEDLPECTEKTEILFSNPRKLSMLIDDVRKLFESYPLWEVQLEVEAARKQAILAKRLQQDEEDEGEKRGGEGVSVVVEKGHGERQKGEEEEEEGEKSEKIHLGFATKDDFPVLPIRVNAPCEFVYPPGVEKEGNFTLEQLIARLNQLVGAFRVHHSLSASHQDVIGRHIVELNEVIGKLDEHSRYMKKAIEDEFAGEMDSHRFPYEPWRDNLCFSVQEGTLLSDSEVDLHSDPKLLRFEFLGVHLFKFSFLTTVGTSGSPIFALTESGYPVVVGVHCLRPPQWERQPTLSNYGILFSPVILALKTVNVVTDGSPEAQQAVIRELREIGEAAEPSSQIIGDS